MQIGEHLVQLILDCVEGVGSTAEFALWIKQVVHRRRVTAVEKCSTKFVLVIEGAGFGEVESRDSFTSATMLR